MEVSFGELLDKISILRIKSRRLTDPGQLRNVRAELEALEGARDQTVTDSPELTRLAAELEEVNEVLWQVEDDLRLCDRHQDFSQRFIDLARSVYRHNDRRAALKRRINELLGA